MSASMLRQMLEDASAQLKDGNFQHALDSSRRVTQFDPTNFQAFLCVGLASLQLRQVATHKASANKPVGRAPLAADLSPLTSAVRSAATVL